MTTLPHIERDEPCPYTPENLLEIQIFEAFQECMKKLNQVEFLRHLESLSNNGL